MCMDCTFCEEICGCFISSEPMLKCTWFVKSSHVRHRVILSEIFVRVVCECQSCEQYEILRIGVSYRQTICVHDIKTISTTYIIKIIMFWKYYNVEWPVKCIGMIYYLKQGCVTQCIFIAFFKIEPLYHCIISLLKLSFSLLYYICLSAASFWMLVLINFKLFSWVDVSYNAVGKVIKWLLKEMLLFSMFKC